MNIEQEKLEGTLLILEMVAWPEDVPPPHRGGRRGLRRLLSTSLPIPKKILGICFFA